MGKRDRIRQQAANEGKKTAAVIDAIKDKIPKQSNLGIYSADQWKSSIQEVHIRTEAVTWGIPMDELCFTHFFENFVCHQRPMPWDNIALSRSTYLPTARNRIHEAFVNEHNTKWLAMLDSDVLPPPNYLTKLFADIKANPDIKIIGGWYKRKTGLQDPVVYDHVVGISFEQRKVKGTGIEIIDGAGAGCWLMSREVAKAIGPMPYNMNEGGEDLHLCRKIKAAGFSIYLDWDVECAHVGVGVY